MKVNAKVLALMTALAAGVAGAQNTTNDGTPSGTKIDNVATATFTDPTTNAAATPVSSNTVTTTVLPKPGFDIVYADGTDGTEGTPAGGNDPTTAQSTATLAPGGTLATPYNVVNNGNTVQNITLATQPNTQYYYATDTGFTTPITGPITVQNDDPTTTTDEGIVKIIQVITVPTDGSVAPGATISSTPIGTGEGFNGTAPVSVTESTTVLGLQYATVTVYKPVLDNSATPGATPTKPVDPSGNPYTPPATTIVTPPGGSSTPGYTDPSGTPVVGLGTDDQKAYPKADADNNPDTVTFTNTVTNNGSQDDQVQLFPVDPVTKAPLAGVTYDAGTGTFTYPDGTKVQFLDPTTGNPIPVAPGATYPTLTVPAGGTAYYQTKVTYPDPDDSAEISPIVINIGADSLKDTGIVSDSETTDTIYPAAAQFGDTTPTQGAVDGTPNKTAQPGQTVAFPMDVANNGTYPDTYTLSGTVQFPVTDSATPATVNVDYYPVSAWTDTNGNGIVDAGELTGSPITQTGSVAPGTEVKLIAVVTIPTNAAATGTGTKPALQQSATGDYSTIPMTDTNDTITVQPAGSMAVAKFVQGGNGTTSLNGLTAPTGYATGTINALPGAASNYVIMAKNNYNVEVANFALNDTLNKYLTLGTATCSILLKDNVTTQPCTVDVPVTNADGTTTVKTVAATLPQGATMTLTIPTTIK